MKNSSRLILIIAMALAAIGETAPAVAERGQMGSAPLHYDRGGPAVAERGEVGSAPLHYDRGGYYPPAGRVYPGAPHGAVGVPYHGGRYYYHQGNWYHQNGSNFVVVLPPIGLVAPFLPPYYSTFWIGGYPYYYANNVYYAWQPQAQGYVVTQPPQTAAANVATPGEELFVYPANGQSDSQQASDRYECHAWAANETGFDPVQPQGGVDESQWPQKREDYQRALAACLTARGYSVK